MDPTSETDTGPDPRARQQEVVAQLGQQALQSDDLDGLMRDAAVTAAETLEVEYAAVLERRSDEDTLSLRQGVGWNDGIVGSATVPADPHSQGGYTLLTEEPVVVDDLRAEERFSVPALFSDHDVVSGISVAIGGPGDPWGVFGVHTTDRREFAEDAAAFVTNLTNVLAAAIDRAETERRLRERERRLERYREYTDGILAAVDDVFYVIDESGTFQRWNESLTAVTGYSDTEVESMHPVAFFDEEDRDSIAAEISEAFETGRARVEADILTKDGDRIPYEFVATRLEAPDGTPVLAGIGRDVTARKERTRELIRYERIVETINDGIYVADDDLRYTMVNDAFAALTGYTRENLQGAHATRVIDEATIEEAAEMRAVMATDETANPTQETTVETADGTNVPVEVTFASFTADGEENRVGVVRDITDREERERALEESERRYRTLVENFPDGAVGLYDEDLTYTVAGGEMLNVLDIPPDEIVGVSIYERYPDDLVEEIKPHFRAAFEGESNTFEVEYHDRHLLAHTLPVRNGADEIYAGMLMIQDITERTEYRRQLEASNERLEQFAYAASHDLKEPLRMISSYLTLLQKRYDGELDEDGEEFLKFAVDGADRMRAMIDGLLAYSRIDTQGEPLEPLELDAVLDASVDNLRVRIEESGAELTADSLPRVRGDEHQLQQVFQNLLSNAIEYSGDDPPRIRVWAERAGDEWEVSVRDEGIGIDPDETDQVFEVFQRLHSYDEHAGTGIGLALCQRIVERHGGEIRVESAPEEGATFSFTLPAVNGAGP
ncbi:PAS domain S-box protein [Natronosalvus halobius]|uniref:PAS domain S-box protein n=1 Tax=Natronosalvus halobius TaxID=2953746 RepID=UPI0020A136EF|nr:PAS domain S-box protein [Natronosalvus halobius]USZ73098.1 PAS domain S-box protein [Natronosalvus halobius]